VFDEIRGLPVHPLAVHFAVALLVLSVLLAVLFLVPQTRRWARLPLLLVSLGTVLFTYVARESGEALERVGGQGTVGLGGPAADLVNEHQEASEILWWLVIGFAVVAVAAFLLTRERTTGGAAHGVAAVLVVVAVVMGAFTVRVGELGAKAVWDPADSVDYNT
jgi:uncharacterized membrane protein